MNSERSFLSCRKTKCVSKYHWAETNDQTWGLWWCGAGDHSNGVLLCWADPMYVQPVCWSAAFQGLAAVKTLTVSYLGQIPAWFSIIRPSRRWPHLHDGIHYASISVSCCHRYWV